MTFPVYLTIGSLKIHPHLLFEFLAYTIALILILGRNVNHDPLSVENRHSVIVGSIVGAFLGAKLLAFLQHIDLFTSNSQAIYSLLISGKTIVGGLLGGVIGVELTKKLLKINIATGDLFVYPLLWGIAIGRLGCFFTGLEDKTYGIATQLPWGVDFGDGIPRHPTQLYEIAFLILLFCFLKNRQKQGLKNGELFRLFLILYCTFRFTIDFIKPDYPIFLGMSAIQIICLITLLVYRKNFSKVFKSNP